MATNNQPEATGEIQPDHVNVRVVVFSHGNAGQQDSYLDFHLDSTVSELKDKLHEALTEHPPPERQRLIYQGRPLLNDNATLRQAFSSLPNTTHVLHLIIRPDPTAAPPAPTSIPSQPNPQVQLHANDPHLFPPPTEQPDPAHVAHHHAIHQAQLSHAMLQSQMSILQLQQQLAANNLNPLALAGQPQQPTVLQARQFHAQPASNPPSLPPGFQPAPNNLPSIHAMLAEQQRLRALAPMHGAHNHIHPSNHNPQIAPSSAGNNVAHTGAGLPPVPTVTRVQDTIGPNGERIRTVVNGGVTTHFSGRLGPSPFDRPASAPGYGPTPPAHELGQQGVLAPMPWQHQAHATPLPVPSFGIPINRSFTNTFASPQLATPQAASTMAWLVNSPSGPQALLFAPGHGYFSSAPGPAANNTAAGSEAPTPTTNAANGAPAHAAPADHGARHPGQRLQVAQIPARQAGQPLAQAGPQNQDENDLLALFLQRGWLFLRLYMFMFVLSEPGTWRRYILLGLAIIICILPRDNPFNQGFMAARRHVDNLIGPPARPAALPAQQPPGNPNAAVQRPAQGEAQQTEARRLQITPEQNARRLVNEHHQHNANMVQNIYSRVEQGVALFFASLVPGVGERHVRAREEVRRDIQRQQEQERVAAAAQEAATLAASAAAESETMNNSSSQEDTSVARGGETSKEGLAGTSTGVDASSESTGELRSRGAETASSTQDGGFPGGQS